MNNWKLHFWYMLAFAILLLITIITYWLGGKGNEMVSYVSFASALISIVLALVAIFYSMSQNTSSQQNIGEMKTLIEQASTLMAEKASAMTDEAKAMRETGRAIIDKIQPLPEVTGESKTLEGPPFQLDVSRTGPVLLIVLYCLGKSCKHHKHISFKEIMALIYKEDKLGSSDNIANAMVALAMVNVLQCLFEKGSMVNHNFSDVEVKNLPANFTKHVLDEVEKRIKESSATESYFKESIQAINDYFKS
jgi:hypothetical protein